MFHIPLTQDYVSLHIVQPEQMNQKRDYPHTVQSLFHLNTQFCIGRVSRYLLSA